MSKKRKKNSVRFIDMLTSVGKAVVQGAASTQKKADSQRRKDRQDCGPSTKLGC